MPICHLRRVDNLHRPDEIANLVREQRQPAISTQHRTEKPLLAAVIVGAIHAFRVVL
jgi:hypothetical protein